MGMAEKIRKRRIELGLTQEELAAKLGVQKSAVAKYETGSRCRSAQSSHGIL